MTAERKYANENPSHPAVRPDDRRRLTESARAGAAASPMTKPRGETGLETCGYQRTWLDEPCRQTPGWGTDHKGFGPCSYHDITTARSGLRQHEARVVAQAEQIIEENRAVLDYVRRHPDEKHPLVLLAEERHRSQSLVDMYERKLNAVVAERGEESLMTHGGRDVAGWLKAYNQERDRLTKMNETWLSLGLAERMVSVAERQANDVVAVIRATLRELGVSDVEAGPVMRRHFTELARARGAVVDITDTRDEEPDGYDRYDAISG